MYQLRQAEKDDYAFLLHLNEITMKTYIIQTYGAWDGEVEERYFQESFANANYQVISVNGEDVGCLAVTKSETEIFIDEIQIHPRYQHGGIGRAILESIIGQSKMLAVPVNLEVLKVNQTAYDFYVKIGFQQTGENKTHLQMSRNPFG